LQRAKDTAGLIVAALQRANQPVPEIQFTDDLKEINLWLWEGLLFRDVKEKYPDEYRHWQEQPHLLRMQLPNADGTTTEVAPFDELFAQATRFWQWLLARHLGQTVLAVAHSGITRALLSTAIGLTPRTFQVWQKGNCAISVLNFKSGLGDVVQLESVNQTVHLGIKLPATKSEHRGPRLLLVRHGETDWNRQGRFQGQIDVPLNATGQQQGAKAAEFLQDVPIQQAFSSPLLRPKETAEIILQQHPGVVLELVDDLKEISHGLWEGKLEAEIREEFPDLLQQWKTTPAVVQMPEGENLQQVWRRAIAGWQKIVHTCAQSDTPITALVVAHDAINKAILCSLFGLDPSGFWAFKQGNGAVSVIDYPKGPDAPPVLQVLNITSHLSGGVLDKTAAGAL
jgi:probable phosphoglycerate mutase